VQSKKTGAKLGISKMIQQPKAEICDEPKCILLVDDEAVLRFVVAESLRDAGLTVIEARSGADAVGYLASGARVDLVFSDIQMPGEINGVQLARHVHANYPAIPVLLTSGTEHPSPLNAEPRFIPKPFDLNHVVTTVEQLLG
jgi:CheY-like chemotaxis protein